MTIYVRELVCLIRRHEILEVQQVVHLHKICHSMKSHEISVEEGYFRAHWIDSHDSMTTERANSIVALFTILVPYSLSYWTRTHISQHIVGLALRPVQSNDNDVRWNFFTQCQKLISFSILSFSYILFI